MTGTTARFAPGYRRSENLAPKKKGPGPGAAVRERKKGGESDLFIRFFGVVCQVCRDQFREKLSVSGRKSRPYLLGHNTRSESIVSADTLRFRARRPYPRNSRKLKGAARRIPRIYADSVNKLAGPDGCSTPVFSVRVFVSVCECRRASTRNLDRRLAASLVISGPRSPIV